MSTCPEKDIHSVYLDNELPPVYIKEYEAHVNQCAQCKNELERIKALRDNLRADAAAIALSSADLEKSFERLQARMSYAKVTASSNVHRFFVPKWAIGAAAAVIVAAIALPMRSRTEKNAEIAAVPEQAQTVAEIKPPKIPQAMIPMTHLSSLISEEPNAKPSTVGFSANREQKGLQTIKNSLNSVDVFRPEVPEKAISIKITLSPSVGEGETFDFPVVIEKLYQNDVQDSEK